ncbi:MAG: YbhB/YbcL family Raf kinase inhibitor-like protein [Bdellovibrionales bacterium]
MAMTLKSDGFAANTEMPVRYTGEGQDLSPQLSWEGVPSGTKSLVLIIDDPDAPDPAAPKMTWVHWVLYNIPPSVTGLAEGTTALPAGTREGLNDFKRQNYGGPHPPVGRHRYFHKLYALDTTLDFRDAPKKADVEKAMKGHILSQAVLMGTYQLKR